MNLEKTGHVWKWYKETYYLQCRFQTWRQIGSDVHRVSAYICCGGVHRDVSSLLPVLFSRGPPRRTSWTQPVQAHCQRGELGWPWCHVFQLSSALQLQLCLHLSLLFGLLVALLQVLHQDSNDNIDQDKLGGENEGHEVDGRDHSVVAGGGFMGTVS